MNTIADMKKRNAIRLEVLGILFDVNCMDFTQLSTLVPPLTFATLIQMHVSKMLGVYHIRENGIPRTVFYITEGAMALIGQTKEEYDRRKQLRNPNNFG